MSSLGHNSTTHRNEKFIYSSAATLFLCIIMSSSTRIIPARPHDYLYDPLYTVSCYSDHVKAWSSAQQIRATAVPSYDHMFSDLPQYPSRTTELRVSNLDANLGQIRYVPIDNDPQVTGTNRCKYFRNPVLPSTENLGGQLVYDPRLLVAAHQSQKSTPASKFTKSISVGVQSMYRESHAQTDPYSPEFLAPVGSNTELLSLAHLKYNHGLPARMNEIDAIVRARCKRQCELQLPKVTDDKSFHLRLRMMQAMELQEWNDRESELASIHHHRFTLIAKAIKEAQAVADQATCNRLQAIWDRKLAEKAALRAKFESRRAAELRKLNEKRTRVRLGNSKPDLIYDYASVISHVFYPKPRNGVPARSVIDKVLANRAHSANLLAVPDMLEHPRSPIAGKVRVPPMIASPAQIPPPFQSLEKLESLFPPSVTHASLAPPVVSLKPGRHDLVRPAFARVSKPPRFLIPIPKPCPNPPTPVSDPVNPNDDHRHQVALQMQRWLRGRRVQDDMMKGKTRRLDLIEELKIELLPISLELPQRNAASLEDRMLDQFEDIVQSNYVGTQLEFLDRQILRAQDQHRLAATAMLADRTRQLREAHEVATRRHELARRAKDDARYKAIMHLHQRTVDSFLEDVVATATAQAAEIRAWVRDPVKETDVALESVVSTLVSSFLFPETERLLVQHRVQHAQHRYLVAAHREVYGALAAQIEPLFADEPVTLDKDVMDAYTNDLTTTLVLSASETDLAASLPPDGTDLATRLALPITVDAEHAYLVPLPLSRPGSTLE